MTKMFLVLLTVAATTVTASSAMAMEGTCRGVPAADNASACDHAPNQASLEDPINQPLTRGRVVAVDRSAGKITLEHRPVPRLYLDGGTMIFRVEDPKTLLGVAPGDKVRFDVERDGKSYVVTRIEHSN